jgi:hypothetical protein
LHKCYASPSALNVCSGLDGTCYKSDILIDLGIIFSDDSNIKHTTFITFSGNTSTIDLIIGRRSLNQHNLFVLTPKQIQASLHTGEVDLPYGDEDNFGADSQIGVDCCSIIVK